MPVYEYLCQDCGVFEEIAPMSRFADPCDCPDCGLSAPRVMISVPRLSVVSSATRRAHETNERSADSPKRSEPWPELRVLRGWDQKAKQNTSPC